MTFYGQSSSKRERYGIGSNKSSNQKHGKFKAGRNRHKKMMKSSERFAAKQIIKTLIIN